MKIPLGTYPELVADLNQVAPRERAERLRLLAMMGLRDLRKFEPRPVSDAVSTSIPPQTNPKESATALIRQISKSL